MNPHQREHQVINSQRFPISKPDFTPRDTVRSVTPSLLGTLCAIAFVLATAAFGFAQTSTQWTTVDEFRDGPGGWAWSMAADRSGNVFVAGDDGYISRTNDQGASWTRILHPDVQTYMGIASATVEIAPATESAPAILQDQLVVAGYTPSVQWITRRSLDAGETWETVDVIPSLGMENITGASIDSAGNMYVIGHWAKTTTIKNKSSTSHYWRIRRIANGATAGSEAGKTTFDLEATGGGSPKGITCIGTNVFVAGVSGGRWQVRKLGSGQAQWIVVDDFRYNENYSSEASSIAADGAGNLYVVGSGYTGASRGPGTVRRWIVRRGTGVGITSPFGAISFQIVDNQSSAANGVAAYGVCVDPSGNVYVTGKGSDWITRRHAATSPLTDWVTSDSGGGTIGWDVVSDSSGNIFSAGWNADSYWAVRRLLAP